MQFLFVELNGLGPSASPREPHNASLDRDLIRESCEPMNTGILELFSKPVVKSAKCIDSVAFSSLLN